MSRIDHARVVAARRMERQGTEAADGSDVVHRLAPPRKRASKAEMRAESAKLVREFEARALGFGQSET